MQKTDRDVLIPLVLFVATLIVYSVNLCPSLWWMDSGEFVFHATFLGIPHPTGYPLYIQLGKLLTLLPGIEGPIAVNFFSALMASLTVALLYRVILLLDGEVFASAVTVLLFAFSFTFWSQAEITEVYTLHTFFLTLIMYLLLLARRNDDRRILFLLSFVIGLSLTHHMSTVLVLPAVVLFLWMYRREEVFRAGVLFPSLVFLIIGLSVYLFIPMRAHLPAPFNYPRLHGVDPGSVKGFFWLITGRIVKADMLQYGLGDLAKPVTFYFVKLMRDFVYAGFFLGVYGALCQFRRERGVFYAVLLAFLAYFAFFADYGVSDQHVFFIPSFLFWTVWIGEGVSSLARRARSGAASAVPRAILQWGLITCMTLLVVWSFSRDFHRLDFSRDRGPDEFARKVLEEVEDNALISSIYEATPLLWYHHFVDGMKANVEISDRGLMSLNVRQEFLETHDKRSPLFEQQVDRIYKERLEEYLAKEIGSRPVYLVKYDAFLNDRFHLEEVEHGFYRVTKRGRPAECKTRVPDVSFPGRFRYRERVDIFGLNIDRQRLVEGDLFGVRVYWSAARPLDDEYMLLLRFMKDRELKEYELKENSFMGIYTLGGGMIPLDKLVPGKVWIDDFDCFVPPDIREGKYKVSVALVKRERFYSVPKKELDLEYLDLGTIPVRENLEVRHYWD